MRPRAWCGDPLRWQPRAPYRGRLALLYVYELDTDFQHFASVGRLMEKGSSAEAEAILKRQRPRHHARVRPLARDVLRKGNRHEELFKLAKEHPEFSMLVLGAAPGAKPGPLSRP